TVRVVRRGSESGDVDRHRRGRARLGAVRAEEPVPLLGLQGVGRLHEEGGHACVLSGREVQGFLNRRSASAIPAAERLWLVCSNRPCPYPPLPPFWEPEGASLSA